MYRSHLDMNLTANYQPHLGLINTLAETSARHLYTSIYIYIYIVIMAHTIPSAEAPLQNFTTRLLPVLTEKGMYPFLCRFSDLANSIRDARLKPEFKQASIGTDRTVMSFDTDFREQWLMARLTLAIPLDLIKSILAGTVAYDSHAKPALDWYPLTGPGIYVVGLKVNGRNGKFLSRNEISQLRALLERYCQGYLAIQAQSPPNHPDIGFVKAVDRQLYAPKPSGKTLFIDNEEELRRIRCLAVSLGRRCDDQLDPGGSVQQIQSPLYVGCSNVLEKRTKSYTNRTIGQMNKSLGITLSLLEMMGLPSTASCRCATPIWDESHMKKGERLVTTLASSYVCQDGFNATEAGGNPGTATLESQVAAQEMAFASRSHMAQNTDAAMEEMERRVKFLERAKQVDEKHDGLERALEEHLDRGQNRASLSQMHSSLRATMALMEAHLEERRPREQVAEGILELQSAILSAFGVPLPETEDKGEEVD